jgi:hypothetical protein
LFANANLSIRLSPPVAKMRVASAGLDLPCYGLCLSALGDVAVVHPCGPGISASPDACFLSRSRDGIRAGKTAPRPRTRSCKCHIAPLLNPPRDCSRRQSLPALIASVQSPFLPQCPRSSEPALPGRGTPARVTPTLPAACVLGRRGAVRAGGEWSDTGTRLRGPRAVLLALWRPTNLVPGPRAWRKSVGFGRAGVAGLTLARTPRAASGPTAPSGAPAPAAPRFEVDAGPSRPRRMNGGRGRQRPGPRGPPYLAPGEEQSAVDTASRRR